MLGTAIHCGRSDFTDREVSRCFPDCSLEVAPVVPTIFATTSEPLLVGLAGTTDGALTVLGSLTAIGGPPQIAIGGGITTAPADNESMFLVSRSATNDATARIYADNDGWPEAWDLVADGNRLLSCGNVVGPVNVEGTVIGDGSKQEPFIVVQDSAFAVERTLVMPTTLNNGQCKSVDVRNGILAVTGIVSATVDPGGGVITSSANPNAFIAVYDSNTFAWRWQQGLLATSQVFARVVTVAEDDGIYAGGRFEGNVDFAPPALTSAGAFDGYLIRYDASGGYRWSLSIRGAGEELIARATRQGGGVCVCGNTTSASLSVGSSTLGTSGHDVFVACFDDAGGVRWTRALQAGGEGLCTAAVTDSATLLVAGSVADSADFGAGAMAINGNVGFVAAYDTTGALTGLALFDPGSAVDGLATTEAGLWAAGTFTGTLTVDGVPYTSDGPNAGFIAPVRLMTP